MPVPPSGRIRRRTLVSLLVVALAAAAVAGAWIAAKPVASAQTRNAAATAEGTLAPGFHAPDRTTYYSSQVVEPDPETWTDVRPSGRYRVLLLAQGRDDRTAHDAQVAILVDAVKRWARDESRIALTVEYLGDPHTSIDDMDHAARSKAADLIVVAGNGLVDPVAVVSANYAGEDAQQFLVLGAEVAEPTTNITATDWAGSAYLGEGVPEADYYDPASVTAPRAYAALRAGAAAVLSGYTGVIVRIPVDRY